MFGFEPVLIKSVNSKEPSPYFLRPMWLNINRNTDFINHNIFTLSFQGKKGKTLKALKTFKVFLAF